MEVAIGAVTIGALIGGYRKLRKHLKTDVNCWFCNGNFRVKYTERNSFICPGCQQYNGFDENGDYNRVVPGQRAFGSDVLPGYRFCTPKSKPQRRDWDRDSDENGLCEECNLKQTVILEKVNAFEPVNEDKWDEELEEFKYRLDKLFPLCSRCTIFCHQKLQEDKRKFSALLSLKEAILASKPLQPISSLIAKVKKRRFFNGGFWTELCHWISLSISISLFFAQLNYVQQDADVHLVSLPHILEEILPFVLTFSLYLNLIALLVHLVSTYSNKCRTTFPDLVFPLTSCVTLISYLFNGEVYKEDLALCRCAFTAGLSILSFAVTLVPRKRRHRKRPNNVLASAFSVASTPVSQCSSQDQYSLMNKSNANASHDMNSSFVTYQKWREQRQSPEPDRIREHISEMEDMEWEPSEVSYPSKKRCDAARESTPARELAPSLSNMSLKSVFIDRAVPAPRASSTWTQPLKRRGERNGFPSFATDLGSPASRRFLSTFKQTVNPGINRSPSIFSGMTSVSRRLPQRDSPISNTEPSVFTSVSQQQEPNSNFWNFAVATFAISSLIGNIAFFYFVFKKSSEH